MLHLATRSIGLMDIHNVDFTFQPDGAKPFKSEIGPNISRTFMNEGDLHLSM